MRRRDQLILYSRQLGYGTTLYPYLLVVISSIYDRSLWGTHTRPRVASLALAFERAQVVERGGVLRTEKQAHCQVHFAVCASAIGGPREGLVCTSSSHHVPENEG